VHYLVLAEEGFSTLSHYALESGLDRATQRRFADEVGRRRELGTLLPQAPISAMPSAAVRQSEDPNEVLLYLREMRTAVLAKQVQERNIVVDIGLANETPDHVFAALRAFETDVTEDAANGIEWFVIGMGPY
jgi:hypothetical protein